MQQALYVNNDRSGIRLWGWMGLPTFSRSQADLQHFFVLSDLQHFLVESLEQLFVSESSEDESLELLDSSAI